LGMLPEDELKEIEEDENVKRALEKL
jgi:hypothetical protein